MPIPFVPKHRSHVSASRFSRKALTARLKKLQARERKLLGRRTPNARGNDAEAMG